ncbi:hypothetical protein DSECCO2_512390 [anaerobic digester metagenome]
MLDEVANQGFGDRSIDPIHRHVVSVVGRPSQGKLGQVACSHHQSIQLVGQIHQHLGPFTCLAVFVGDVQHLRIVTDILEMLSDGFRNRDGPQFNTQGLGKLYGIAFGTFGGTKARHGYRNDAASAQTQHIESPYTDQQGQR